MTKQELAESMAEFLELKIITDESGMHYEGFGCDEEAFDDWVFSPDGFFAVWNKLGDETSYLAIEKLPENDFEGQAWWCVIGFEPKENCSYGPDRYTAFYEAVHEMKTTKEKVLNDQERTD